VKPIIKLSLAQKRLYFIFMLVSLFLFVPFNRTTGNEQQIFFEIDLLAPASCPLTIYNVFSNTIVEELPKIGIGINETDFSGWAHIANRTWNYPGPYPIPPYDKGGYDIFLIGLGWWESWNPASLYNSSLMPPNGDNFYQYANPLFDSTAHNYSHAWLNNDRLHWAQELQAILYEDLPTITLFYPKDLYPHHVALEGWNSPFWMMTKESMENWSIPGKSTFSYALPAEFEYFFVLDSDHYDGVWLQQIYNALLTLDPLANNNYTSRLATSYSSSDGLTYTIQINPSAVWADGVTLNASDVEFTYKLLLTPEFRYKDYDYWTKYLTNDSIVINNEFELTITFSEGCVFPEDFLTIDLVPKHIWEGVPYGNFSAQAKDWAEKDPSKIIGAGPYMLAEYNKSANFIHLIKNPYFKDWFGSAPKFNDIYFYYITTKSEALNALASGEIDMVDTQYAIRVDEVPSGTAYTLVNTESYYEMAINNYHPIIGTGEHCPIAGKQSAKYVRRAINHIVPREVIKNAWGAYLLEDGIVPCPQNSPFFDSSLQPFNYNLTKAKHYMELAGYIFQSTSPTPSISLTITPIVALMGAVVIFLRFRKRQKKPT